MHSHMSSKWVAIACSMVVSAVHAQYFSLPLPLAEPDFNGAQSMAHGDLDQDGDLDIVVGSAGSIVAYFNDGNGGFSSAIQLADTYRAYQVRLADIDGDGDLDISWANFYEPSIGWIENLGSGQFAPGATLMDDGVSMNCTSIAWADADNDGHLDLLAASYGQSRVVYYRALGGGSFASPVTLMSGSSWSCEFLDVDGDGHLDALFGAVSVSWRKAINGDFTVPQPSNVGVLTPTTGVRSFAVANVDADAPQEFFFAEPTGGTVKKANFMGVDQPFFITTVDQYNPAVGVGSLATADMNGDGEMDLIVPCTGDHTIRIEFGPQFLQPVIITNVPGAGAVSPMDVDGDGLLDLVVLSTQGDAVFVYRQVVLGIFSRTDELTPIGGNITDVIMADLDGDEVSDVVFMFSGSQRLAWRKNMGQGEFGPMQVIDDVISGPTKLIADDLDGDGDLDILASLPDVGVRWYRNNGSGVFDQPLNITTGFAPGNAIALTDMNGDGSPDILLFSGPDYYNNSVLGLINTGGGNFEPPQVLLANFAGVKDMILGDLDNDGDQDLVLTNNWPYVSLNNGDWTFPVPTMVVNGYTDSSVLADLNQDGTLDLLRASDLGSFGVQVLFGNGDGTFADPFLVDAAFTECVRAGDLDNDGLLDIVAARTDGSVWWYKNDGQGAFLASPVGDSYFGEPRILVLNDLDSDGDLDILAASSVTDKAAWYKSFLGSVYSFEGHAYYDMDGSGAYSAGDLPYPYEALSCSPAGSMIFTGLAGYYSMRVDPGTYSVTFAVADPLWVPLEPSSYEFNLADSVFMVSGVDFGFVPALDTIVVELDAISGVVRCGQNYNRWIEVWNYGTLTADVQVQLFMHQDDSLLQSTPQPSGQQPGQFTWSLPQIPPFGHVQIAIEGYTEMIGGELDDSLVVTSVHGAHMVVDTVHCQRPVMCSFDPNMKEVFPEGRGTHHAVDIDQKELTYVIHFQNTGNDTAFVIELQDHLSELLDPVTIRVIGSSHTLTSLEVDPDRNLIARFENILLPDSTTDLLGSEGYLAFAIKPVPDLPSGSVVTNAVDIYFDVNEPVTTNTVFSTFIDCALSEAEASYGDFGSLVANEGVTYQWYLNGSPIDGATEQIIEFDENGSYTVRVTDEYGCSPLSTPLEVLSTSIAQAGYGIPMVLMPNPATGSVRVHLPTPVQDGDRMFLLDMYGQVLHENRLNSDRLQEFSLQGVAPGIYIVQWSGSEGRKALARLVVQ